MAEDAIHLHVETLIASGEPVPEEHDSFGLDDHWTNCLPSKAIRRTERNKFFSFSRNQERKC